MPNWKFWGKPAVVIPPLEVEEEPRRFTARPRTDLINITNLPDQSADQLVRLQRRRETALFDVLQAEAANDDENHWIEQVRLIDEALDAISVERADIESEVNPPGMLLPATPISNMVVDIGPPPHVSFAVGPSRFVYEEEIDWAERGFQIARGELILIEGDPIHLTPAACEPAQREQLADHLTSSLFAFASDLRDLTLEGHELPVSPTLHDLAIPDAENGGWLEWGGRSPNAARLDARRREFWSEEQRLKAEREREIAEAERWADRLPVARRRLAEVDAEIASLRG